MNTTRVISVDSANFWLLSYIRIRPDILIQTLEETSIELKNVRASIHMYYVLESVWRII